MQDWLDQETGKVVGESPLSTLRQFLGNESSLKMMKNVIYFMLKPLFVFKIFEFMSWHFGYVQKGLVKKIEVF